MFLLNELHMELKQLKWNTAADQRACADSQVNSSLSDAEFTSTAGGDVVSLADDDSSCHSLTSADDAVYVCAPASVLLIF